MGFGLKFFIVLNLVVAVALLMSSFTTFYKKIKLIESLASATNQYNELQQKATADQKTAKLKIDSLTLENEKLQGELNSKVSEYINLEKRAKLTEDNYSSLMAQFRSFDSSLTKLQADSQRDKELLAQKDEELRTALADRSRLELQARTNNELGIQALTELKNANDRIALLERQYADLVSRTIEQEETINALRSGATLALSPTPTAPISSRVLNVSEEIDTVVLGVGERDAVKPGMHFIISRGMEFIAEVQVQSVTEGISLAKVVPGMKKQPIAINDLAQTL